MLPSPSDFPEPRQAKPPRGSRPPLTCVRAVGAGVRHGPGQGKALDGLAVVRQPLAHLPVPGCKDSAGGGRSRGRIPSPGTQRRAKPPHPPSMLEPLRPRQGRPAGSVLSGRPGLLLQADLPSALRPPPGGRPPSGERCEGQAGAGAPARDSQVKWDVMKRKEVPKKVKLTPRAPLVLICDTMRVVTVALSTSARGGRR